jgi:sensor histidine kinase YesM
MSADLNYLIHLQVADMASDENPKSIWDILDPESEWGRKTSFGVKLIGFFILLGYMYAIFQISLDRLHEVEATQSEIRSMQIKLQKKTEKLPTIQDRLDRIQETQSETQKLLINIFRQRSAPDSTQGG